jgi:hypothetical protein
MNDQAASTDNQHFSNAITLLEELINSPAIARELDRDGSANAQQVYTNAATIFALILQRLGGGLTLKQTVTRMIDQHSDLLRQDNRRVRQGTLSQNASAYDKARRTLPLQKIAAFCQLVCQSLADQTDYRFEGRRIYIVDGTTLALPPTKELAENFSPSKNQHGQSPWPIMSLLVAHEMDSSCCLVPEVGAMYGSKNTSEIKLFKTLIAERMPAGSIVMGDTGFGVFATAFHCQRHNHRFVLGLTAQRFRSHIRRAVCVDEGEGFRTYEYLWKPSSKERKTHDELPADAQMCVFIHQIDLVDEKTLYLVSDLQYDAATIAALYRRRYDGEFDIRDVKVTMNTEHMRARSYDTIMKELYGSVIAYNLVVQFRREAARRRGVAPRRLSFSDTWLDFQVGVLGKSATDLSGWKLLYEAALERASKRLLPDRRGKRTSPRVSYRKRPKATKFEVKSPQEAAQIREANRKRALE